jgi:putative inorganic carbon (HCO3(-)) transporter
MENQSKVSFQIDLYWFYLLGFFLILFLPLLILPPWFIPIGWGKTIAFRITLSLLILLFISQVLFKKISLEYIKNKIRSILWPFWLLFALFGIYLLATIFSLDPNFSLWGDPVRSGGFVNFAFYIFLSIVIFLIIRSKDWQRIWDFSIIVGILVSIIAIVQQFGLYSKFILTLTDRPVSTLGNPILVATYLLLLTFVSLSFGIKTDSWRKKIFYFLSSLLFIFISIIITQARGAFVGLAIGFIWFLFTYPKKLKMFKISAGIILILLLLGMYGAKTYLDSHLYVYQKIPSLIIIRALDRALSIFETTKIIESRISTWKVSINALKERPLLGYGPENFMIAFDKYYDPSLPLIGYDISGHITEWWDRAHNFILEISITTGIPALIIYLAFIIILFGQLQKMKKVHPETAIISHGIQATFLSYLTASLFGIDSFDTFIMFFLLIGYSFFIISNSQNNQNLVADSTNKEGYIYRYRLPITFILSIFFIWFIWFFNLKPLFLTKELNLGIYYSEKRKCEKALKIVDEISPSASIIDNYLKQRSVGIIHDCTDEKIKPPVDFSKQAILLLKKNAESHPQYLQNWLLLAEYTNVLIEEEKKLSENVSPTAEMLQLKDEANEYFQKSLTLSPRRSEIIKEWLKTDLITGDYKNAEKKAQTCIDLSPNYGGCYWLMALIQGYLKNPEGFNHYAALARERNYDTQSAESLPQLINMYIGIGDYENLAKAYLKLIEITTDKQREAQLHASLAAVYVELGQIENAKKEALKILELLPFFPADLQTQAKADVEAFLKSLEQ